MEELEETFVRYDANSDGLLNKFEFTRAVMDFDVDARRGGPG